MGRECVDFLLLQILWNLVHRDLDNLVGRNVKDSGYLSVRER
jgi:hypothetical protein